MPLPTIIRHPPRTMKDKIRYILCILTSLVLILWALPQEKEAFNYDYSQGQPWRYDPLIAKFAFPVKKPESKLRMERAKALEELTPYFNAAPAIGMQMVRNFRSDYAEGRFKDVPYSYYNHAVELLQQVYAQGVVTPEDYKRMQRDKTTHVSIINDKTATTHAIGEIFSTRTAYQYLMENESETYSREIMAKLSLNEYLEANIIYDSLKTREARENILASVATTDGYVEQGELIIDRAERVDSVKKAKLDSFRDEVEQNSSQSASQARRLMVGQGGMVIILFALLLTYLNLFRRDLFSSFQSICLLFCVITFFCVISCLMLRFNLLTVYLIPFAMAAIFVRIFMDTRTAFMVHTVLVLIASIPLVTCYQFVLIEMVGGIVAIYSLRDLTERQQLFRTAAYVTAAMCAMGLCYELSQGVSLNSLNKRLYTHIAFNGVALLSAYPLLYLIERIFGFTSTVTLIELSNTNSRILRRMSKEAQGTFIHSMQVANLAAEVADKIGAKVQLVRTGALYHDIGKLSRPAFFTENQTDVNPHDMISEKSSAAIIIGHVTEGLKMAEREQLPKIIRDFILTHHGTGMARYFYIQSCNKLGEENVNKEDFTYPGRNPFTREQAILMMADAVEAASRSLKEYNEESISALVNRIIDSQQAEGYFKECPITFKDISDAKHVFTDSLKTIYHTRIAYPELNRGEQGGQEQPKDENPAPAHRKKLFSSNNWVWKGPKNPQGMQQDTSMPAAQPDGETAETENDNKEGNPEGL